MYADPAPPRPNIAPCRREPNYIKMTIGPCTAVSAAYARVRTAEIITDTRATKNPAGRRSKAPNIRDLGKRFLNGRVLLAHPNRRERRIVAAGSTSTRPGRWCSEPETGCAGPATMLREA